MVEIVEQTSNTMDASDKNTTQTISSDRSDNADAYNAESKLLKSSINGSAPRNGLKKQKSVKSEQDRKMTEDINKLLRDMPLTDDMTCGFWIFKGTFFQR